MSRAHLWIGLLFAFGLAMATSSTPAQSQTATPALLVADNITFTAGAARLTANGNVEIFHKGRMLRAREIRYDRQTDRLEIVGPITLIEDDETILP